MAGSINPSHQNPAVPAAPAAGWNTARAQTHPERVFIGYTRVRAQIETTVQADYRAEHSISGKFNKIKDRVANQYYATKHDAVTIKNLAVENLKPSSIGAEVVRILEGKKWEHDQPYDRSQI